MGKLSQATFNSLAEFSPVDMVSLRKETVTLKRKFKNNTKNNDLDLKELYFPAPLKISNVL